MQVDEAPIVFKVWIHCEGDASEQITCSIAELLRFSLSQDIHKVISMKLETDRRLKVFDTMQQ